MRKHLKKTHAQQPVVSGRSHGFSHWRDQVWGVFSCSVTNGFSGWAETYFNPPDVQTHVLNHSLQEAIRNTLVPLLHPFPSIDDSGCGPFINSNFL